MMNYLFVSVDSFEFMTKRVKWGRDEHRSCPHGLGYAHSVTYCNAMWVLNYAILGHFVIFKCFLKAFILCEQYQVFFHSGCRELLRYLKSGILFWTCKTLKQHRALSVFDTWT